MGSKLAAQELAGHAAFCMMGSELGRMHPGRPLVALANQLSTW
jgi:hypothetical protein